MAFSQAVLEKVNNLTTQPGVYLWKDAKGHIIYVGKAVNPLSCEGQIEGGVVMSIGFALREHYPIDENCKPIDKYGSLGLFRSHEIPKIDAIVVDKPGLNVACGAIGIGEITSIPTAPAIADAYFRWNGERQYSLPLTGTPYERKC